MTGEVSFQAANAKSAANLKVKGTLRWWTPFSVFYARFPADTELVVVEASML